MKPSLRKVASFVSFVWRFPIWRQLGLFQVRQSVRDEETGGKHPKDTLWSLWQPRRAGIERTPVFTFWPSGWIKMKTCWFLQLSDALLAVSGLDWVVFAKTRFCHAFILQWTCFAEANNLMFWKQISKDAQMFLCRTQVVPKVYKLVHIKMTKLGNSSKFWIVICSWDEKGFLEDVAKRMGEGRRCIQSVQAEGETGADRGRRGPVSGAGGIIWAHRYAISMPCCSRWVADEANSASLSATCTVKMNPIYEKCLHLMWAGKSGVLHYTLPAALIKAGKININQTSRWLSAASRALAEP